VYRPPDPSHLAEQVALVLVQGLPELLALGRREVGLETRPLYSVVHCAPCEAGLGGDLLL
jgi:hypothetical protein